MNFKFSYRTTSWDYFRLSMYYVYGSMIGICNIIFTVAMILLTFKMWNSAASSIRIVLLLACVAFPIIQPISLYNRARKQAAAQKENMQIAFDDMGMHITADEERADIEWKSIKRVSRKPGMIIVFSDATHGYLITDRMLGAQKNDFYQFIYSKIDVNK